MRKRWRHVVAGLAAALLAGCGRVGVELVGSGSIIIDDGGSPTEPMTLGDAGSSDSGQTSAADGAVHGQLPLDASSADADAAAARDDAAPRDAASTEDAASDASLADAAMPPTRCDLSGTWAGKVAVSVTWAGGAIAPGSDTVNVWVKYQAAQDGAIISGSLAMCGLTLPDFLLAPTVANETYGQHFDDTMLFDPIPARVVAPDTTFTVAGNSEPGDTFSLATTSFVLGSTSSSSGVQWPPPQNVDTDQDGRPSVTVFFTNDGTHVYPRANIAGTQRIDEGYFALRITFDASGMLNTCMDVSGPARLLAFDMPLSGCHISGGTDCNGTQRAFIDSARPTYLPAAATWHAFKVLPIASCAFIRGAL